MTTASLRGDQPACRSAQQRHVNRLGERCRVKRSCSSTASVVDSCDISAFLPVATAGTEMAPIPMVIRFPRASIPPRLRPHSQPYIERAVLQR